MISLPEITCAIDLVFTALFRSLSQGFSVWAHGCRLRALHGEHRLLSGRIPSSLIKNDAEVYSVTFCVLLMPDDPAIDTGYGCNRAELKSGRSSLVLTALHPQGPRRASRLRAEAQGSSRRSSGPRAADGAAPLVPSSAASRCSSAIRFSVDGCVENRLSIP